MKSTVSFLPAPVDEMLREFQRQNFPYDWSIENNGTTISLVMSWTLEDQRSQSMQSRRAKSKTRSRVKRRGKRRIEMFLEEKTKRGCEKGQIHGDNSQLEHVGANAKLTMNLKETENSHVSQKVTPRSDISVRNPQTHGDQNKGKYVNYEISVKTTDKAFCLPESVTTQSFDMSWNVYASTE